MIGALLAHGHDLEVLERWSWEEVSLATEALLAYKGWTISKLVEIVGPAFGMKLKKTGASARASHEEIEAFFSTFGGIQDE